MKTVVVTGAAGLVGQNLIPRLKARGYAVIGIDKHPTNTQRLRELHPDIMVIEEDLSEAGPWMDAFAGADAVVINQAQIGGLNRAEFVANNVTATERIVDAMRMQLQARGMTVKTDRPLTGNGHVFEGPSVFPQLQNQNAYTVVQMFIARKLQKVCQLTAASVGATLSAAAQQFIDSAVINDR